MDPRTFRAKFVPIADLSVGIVEDFQVVLSPMWRKTTRGTYVVNTPLNSCIIAPRNATRWAAVFGTTENTTTRQDGKRHVVRPPYVDVRAFVDPEDRGEWTNKRPTYSPSGGLFLHSLPASSCMIEFQAVTPGDALGGDVAIESYKISGDDGVIEDRGMYLELIGFVVDEGATFDPVTIPMHRLVELRHGDSNAGGYVHPTAGGPKFSLIQHRAGIVGQGAAPNDFDPRGARLQWPNLVMKEYCETRGFNRVTLDNSHGGKHQGIRGPNSDAYIRANVWPNPFPDVIDSLTTSFPDETAWNDSAHWGGGIKPDVGFYGSDENDAFQRVHEILNTFHADGEVYFAGSTFQAGIKATLDLWTSTFPDCVIIAHTGTLTDATFTGPLALDTFTRFANACTAGGSSGRGFSTPSTVGAEDAIGFLLKISDYNAQTGLTNAIDAELHYDEAECIAIKEAVKTALFAWLDRALKVVFVDGTNGNNSNAGTYGAPKKTITAAAALTFNRMSIAPGTYAEKLTLPASGTSGMPKQFFGRGAGVIIDGGGVRDGIDVNGKSNVILRNVRIQNVVAGVKSSAGSNIQCKHVTVETASGNGFDFSGSASGSIYACEASACATGFQFSGSSSFTGRRVHAHGCVEGIKITGSATYVSDGDHVHENTTYQARVAGGSGTFRNSKLALGVLDGSSPQFPAIVYCDGGNAVVENCTLFNGNTTPFLPSHSIRCVGSGRVAFRNNVFHRELNDYSPNVWVDAVGASGNIVESKNNVFFDDGQPYRFSWGTTPEIAVTHLYDFTSWQGLTDTSGRGLDRNSRHGVVGLDTTPSTSIEVDEVSSDSIAIGAGTTLSFTTDFYRRTRTTWNAGPK